MVSDSEKSGLTHLLHLPLGSRIMVVSESIGQDIEVSGLIDCCDLLLFLRRRLGHKMGGK